MIFLDQMLCYTFERVVDHNISLQTIISTQISLLYPLWFLLDKAPSLKHFSGTHLEADDFHKAMQDPETVIIDVRNAYESAIGHFKPPKGGKI